MRFKLPKLPELWVLTILSFATRFWNLLYPNQVVFDEIYFKHFAAQYFTGNYYFDIHPPLGKLLLAGWANLLQMNGGFIDTNPAVALRTLPAFAGALIIPLFYLTLRKLKLPRSVATLAALLLLFDGALLVESRYILMDSLLLLFGIGGLYTFLISRVASTTPKRWIALIWSGLLLGAGLSIKWTGLGMLGLVGLISLHDLIHDNTTRAVQALRTVSIGIIALAVYAASFAIHFALLPNSGEGDAFMSEQYQATLAGNQLYNGSKLSFGQKFIELNTVMYDANARLSASHPYSSHWYTWPINYRGVYFWTEQATTTQERYIYMLGNPIVWWLSLAGLLISLALLVLRRFNKQYYPALAVLLVGYVVNLLPFASVSRVLFLYHYFFCLILSTGIAALGLHQLLLNVKSQRTQLYIYGSIVVMVIVGFVFFIPIWYGTPLTTQQLQMRMWLPSWR